MSEEQIALAKRAVACKGWRWMPGMNALGRLDQDGGALRVHGVGRTSVGVQLRGGAFDWRQRTDGRWLCLHGGDVIGSPCEVLPDLTDPATLGCLLALVREAWNDAKVHVLYVDGLYRWECADRHNVHGSGMTEAEALVDALEYAT
jgi:hypothetical protein